MVRTGTTFRSDPITESVTVFHFTGDRERDHRFGDECKLCEAEAIFRDAEVEWDRALRRYWSEV